MKKLFFLLFILTCNGLLAQVQFEARVSKSTLGVNERFRVDFTMNDDGDNLNPPDFEDFKLIGGPNVQISQSFVNGRGTFNKTYSYFLMPTRMGTFTIRPASIEIRGQVYHTAPIKITITKAIPIPKDPNDPQAALENSIHLVAEMSKTNPYINEPVTVVYKMYFNNVNILNWRQSDKPKYNDFWSQNIELKEFNPKEDTYNGERYYSVILAKTILYPQKSGKLAIEPFAMDLDVQVPSGRRNFFGQQMLVDASKRVTSGRKIVAVKALPETGKPDDFTGAVGKFTFKATPTKTTVKYNESLDLNVTVTGSGNLKLFSLPKPVVPSALEMYDPVHTEKVDTPLSGMTGNISDKYTIVPQYKGDYAIKGMSFSYFDPSAGRYKTLTSPEIMIKVPDGPTPAAPVSAKTETGIGKKDEVKLDHFRSIKLKTQLVNIRRKDFFGSTLFYSLLLLPLVLIPLIILVRRKKEAIDGDIVGNRIKMSNKLAKKYLSQARKHLNNKEQFYIALEKAMHNFLRAKLNIETTEMSKAKITELLLSRNANPETVEAFIDLTESCEFARYAPATTGSIQHDYERAAQIISDLEKQIGGKNSL